MRPVLLMLLALPVGCAEDPFILVPRNHDDTGSPTADTTDGVDTADLDTAPCTAVLEIYGPDDPVVGDEWLVWMRCDGVTIVGAGVLRFDPPGLATVDVNLATFIESGEPFAEVAGLSCF